MDLLSPSESQAFKTFLSSIDYNDALPAPEWGMYATSMGEDLLLEDIPQGKEALTKATKDLMSLDYAHHGHHGHHFQPQHHHHPFQYSHGTHQAYDEQRHREQQHQQSQNQQQATYASTRHESFPFLQSSKPSHNHSHQHNQRQVHQQHSFHHPSQHVTPRHTLNTSVPSSSSSSSGSSNYSSTTPTSPHPPYALPPSTGQALHPQLLPAPPPSAPVQVQIRPASPRAQGKRPSEGTIKPHGTNVSGNDAKRRKSSPTTAPPAPSTSSSSNAKLPCKPALLSPSQKKANHIQSEQKRRANIRRGYEALCETVPALREAIREEEMAAGQEKKGKKRKKGKGDKSEDAENSKFHSLGIDGRAGPRSENVVLAKTIEHITALLADRSSLLARLHTARSSLPPGHTALISDQDPLWEREWKGGSGRIDDEDVDEDDDDEDGE